MKKLLLLILALSTLSIVNVSASEEIVHNSWHYYIDEFIYNDTVIEVRIFPNDNNKIKVSQDGQPVFLTYDDPSNECRRINNLKFCYEGQSFSPNDKSDISYSGKLVPGIKLVIYNVYDKKQLTITKKIEPSSLSIGQEGKVTVDVKNTGDTSAYNVIMTETLPKGLVLVKTLNKEYDVLGNKLVTNAIIAPDKTYTYEYIVRMETLKDVELLTNMTYEYDSGDKFTDSQNLKIPLSGFRVTYSFDPSQADINEISEFVIKAENVAKNEDDEIETINIDNLRVSFPLSLRVIPISSQIKSTGYNNFLIQDTLVKDQVRNYRFNVESDFLGTYDAYVDFEAVAFKSRYRVNETVKLEVTNDLVKPSITINPKLLRAGNEIILQAYIENTQEDEIYYDVEATLSSDILTKTITAERLLGQERIEIYPTRRLRVPLSSVEDELDFTVVVTFATDSGEQFKFTSEETIKVFPASKSFLVEVTPNKEIMHLNEENTVAVNVKNLLEESVLDFKIRDEHSRPINIITESTSASLALFDGDSRQAYLYKFTLPENFPDDELNITTYASSASNNYQEIIVTTIQVNRTMPIIENTSEVINGAEQNNSNNQNQNENNETGEVIYPEDEETFWDKVANFFKSLFSR